jgi:outer membrane protein OmpA-like peptidoglycan-associated protein
MEPKMKHFFLAGASAAALLFASAVRFAQDNPVADPTAPPAVSDPAAPMQPGAPAEPEAPFVTPTDPSQPAQPAPVAPADDRATAPQAAPSAQTAQACETRKAVVYFGMNSTSVEDQTKDAITQAAAASGACQVQSVSLVGHADPSGAASYNMELSRQRGEAVKDLLVDQGISASVIQVDAQGENSPTGNAEQNRRVEVEIVLAQAGPAPEPVG